METWILGALVLAIIAALVAATVKSPIARRAEAQRRRRYELLDSAQRLPLAGTSPSADSPQDEQPAELSLALRPGSLRDLATERSPASTDTPGIGRLVMTPDGESILTHPPFALRPALFTRRIGRFVALLSRRLPAWVVCCPRVRLDTLVTPTPPDGRDPADWRQWRQRVRVRSVDLVLCDRRTWQPLLAILFEPPGGTAITKVAGGRDRMIDEVLNAVGLPVVHASGRFAADWPMIRPYVDQAILPSLSDESLAAADPARRLDPEAAGSLLIESDDDDPLLRTG